ncbi:hypothetical protein RvY_08564 [Ramazzottius varieornatus]|uniref:Uncharacterized protein n=1 Tax=Ramazzottius varieornatus TaxID=947166 RepID=A0A1D1VEC3_RAMVA|nr:hypothetical protein RvY_08564 [Ramazzottius varieornatus]
MYTQRSNGLTKVQTFTHSAWIFLVQHGSSTLDEQRCRIDVLRKSAVHTRNETSKTVISKGARLRCHWLEACATLRKRYCTILSRFNRLAVTKVRVLYGY